MNIYRAKNIFIGLNQGESAYWQVKTGNTVINPAPWTDSLLPGEPDFSWCGASDAAVRTGCSHPLFDPLDPFGIFLILQSRPDWHSVEWAFTSAWSAPAISTYTARASGT